MFQQQRNIPSPNIFDMFEFTDVNEELEIQKASYNGILVLGTALSGGEGGDSLKNYLSVPIFCNLVISQGLGPVFQLSLNSTILKADTHLFHGPC